MENRINSNTFLPKLGFGLVIIFLSLTVNAQYSRSINSHILNYLHRSTEAVEVDNELLFVNIHLLGDTIRLTAGKLDSNGETYGYKFQNITGIPGSFFCISGIALTSDGKITFNILALNSNTFNKLAYVKYDYTNNSIEEISLISSSFHKSFARSRQKGDSLITYYYNNTNTGLYRISCSINNIANRTISLVTDTMSSNINYFTSIGSKNHELFIDNFGNEFFTVNKILFKRSNNGTYFHNTFNGDLTTRAISEDNSGNIVLISSNIANKYSPNLDLISQDTLSFISAVSGNFSELYFLNNKWVFYGRVPGSTTCSRVVMNQDFTLETLYSNEFTMDFPSSYVRGQNSIYLIGKKIENFFQGNQYSVAAVKDIDLSNIQPFIEFNQPFEHGPYHFHTGHFNNLFRSNETPTGLRMNVDNQSKSLIFAAFNNILGISGGETFGIISSAGYHDLYVGPYTPYEYRTIANFDKYCRGYYVDQDMIYTHIWNFTNPNYVMPFGIREWPAHGDTSMGQAANLAPFIDVNANGVYEPLLGDHPIIYGDRCVLNLFHQNPMSGNFGLLPYKMECYQYYYVYDCDTSELMQNTIFVNQRYRMLDGELTDAVAGVYVDYDIGNFSDDYIGTNVDLGMIYGYNGDLNDESNGGQPGYGLFPPASGMMILRGSKLEADQQDNSIGIGTNESINGCGFGDGIIDNEYLTLEASIRFQNFPDPIENFPYLFQGADASGTFPQVNSVDVRYAFFGSSDPSFYGSWGQDHGNNYTETIAGNSPGERRMYGFTGKTNLISSDPEKNTYEIVTAYITAMDSITPNADVLSKLFNFGTQLKTLYNNGSNLCGTILAPNAAIPETKMNTIQLYPNPTEGIIHIVNSEGAIGMELILLNSQGLILERTTIHESESTFSLQNYPSGLYLIRIGNQSVKVIKK
jgi:hypothetical protein